MAIKQQRSPKNIDQSEENWVMDFKAKNSEILQEGQMRYFLPIGMGENLLGLLTFNDRITGRPFSVEDFDLLKTISDQIAAHFLNLKLGEEVQQRKEVEAFQTMSTFFIHDLKNLASTLSLTLQNLPVHFESPEFRQDAIKSLSHGLEKIKGMTSRLRSLSQPFDLQRRETDINELIKDTLSRLDGCLKTSPILAIRSIAKIHVDPEQLQKVIVNLLLNANEAIGEKGSIKIATMQENGYAVVSVEDTGCGMPQEFIENLLFRPFKTTKRQGMGIGLYQSKKIVEAHQGRIEVESEEGRGTTFRVFLPLQGNRAYLLKPKE